jgi:L-histidine N-alpha-methyltransferase
MRLRARRPQRVPVEELGVVLELEAGETIRTEISQKFRLERVRAELKTAGLDVAASWTDAAGDFALVLGLGRRP